MRRMIVSYSWPIRLSNLTLSKGRVTESLNHGLPVLDLLGGHDSWCWLKAVRPLVFFFHKISFTDQAWLVEVARYWPRFFFCAFMHRDGLGQYPIILTLCLGIALLIRLGWSKWLDIDGLGQYPPILAFCLSNNTSFDAKCKLELS